MVTESVTTCGNNNQNSHSTSRGVDERGAAPPPHALPRSRIQLPRGPTHTIRTAVACSISDGKPTVLGPTAHACRSHLTCPARRRPTRFLVRTGRVADHLGSKVSARRQVWSHRAPRLTRIAHALGRIACASVPMPSHSTLHCARRCRLLGARVGALSSRCDAAASGAQRAGLLRARRGYLVAWLVSASAARYSGRPPGRRSPPALAPAGPG